MKVLPNVRCAEAQQGKLGALAHVGSLEQRKVVVGLSRWSAARADTVDEEVKEQLLHVSSEEVAFRNILDQACVSFLLGRRAIEGVN